MRLAKTLLLASTLLSTSSVLAFAEVNVVTSIKPVHSLVSAVMKGVGEPKLVVDGAGSPHNFAMKPSQAQMLEQANVVFWIGHELEAFLEKPLETVAAKAKSIELIDAHGLKKLSFREGGAFDDHGHDDHDDEKKSKIKKGHDDHDKGHDDHDHDKEKKAEADGHEGHAHGKFDPHIWLDPINAKALVHEIEEALVAADPTNAAKYEANAKALMTKIDKLVTEVSAELEPVKSKGYVVFHDAYQYFEKRFDIAASGSITVSPDVMPGAERITEIRARVKKLGCIMCIR